MEWNEDINEDNVMIDYLTTTKDDVICRIKPQDIQAPTESDHLRDCVIHKRLSFHTDNKLRICSWEEEIERYSAKPSSQAIGNKYYDILPRIIVDDKDAIAEAVKKNKAISCK